jgi:hypothetical protein
MRYASLLLLMSFIVKISQIFTSSPPWGVLAESHIYQLVVREDERPDRQDPDATLSRGLSDRIWGIMKAAWQKESHLRPAFPHIVDSWHERSSESSVTISRHTTLPLPPSHVTSEIVLVDHPFIDLDTFFSLKAPQFVEHSASAIHRAP